MPTKLTDQAQEVYIPERFSLVAGGPFHDLLRHWGLLDTDQLPSYKAAAGAAVLAWIIPAIVVSAQSLLNNNYSGWDYFQDPTVYSRYLIAIYIMVATERMADNRVVLLIHQFRNADLLNPEDRIKFGKAVRDADKSSSSTKAELVILAIALVWSVGSTRAATVISAESWEGIISADGGTMLSWAGDVSAFTSNTLFLFLLMRWSWRFILWASLLRTASRMDLQIMPLHPDRCGGLGFLGIFPGIFSGLIFALSCVIAASFYKALPSLTDSQQLIWLAVAVWLLLISTIFLGPLLFFLRPLYLARETGMLDYGRLAHGHHLEFHRKWITERVPGEEILGSNDPSSLSDLNGSVQTVHEMHVIPIDRAALLQLFAAAALPLLLMTAFQMPVVELLNLILGVLL